VVLVHNPPNLDAACALALLQEETTKDAPYNVKKDYKKSEYSPFKYSNRSVASSSSATAPTSSAKKNSEGNKGFSADDKASTLMQYRKAKGLYYKCGQKWHHGHKCVAQVSLHIVEEMWDFMSGTSIAEQVNADSEEDSDSDELCVLSVNAEHGTDDHTKTM
jgi:hypothetical protein